MAGGPGGDEDGKLPPVDHDPLNKGAVGKITFGVKKIILGVFFSEKTKRA
jgi:hypothetical protein